MNPTTWGAGALAILALVGTDAGAQSRPAGGLPGQLPGQIAATPPVKVLSRPDRPVPSLRK